MVPPMPSPTATFPILVIGSMRSVSSAVSVFRTATTSTQKRTTPATHENALSTWSASTQSSKLTRPSYERFCGRAMSSSWGESLSW